MTDRKKVAKLKEGYEEVEEEVGPLVYEWPADYPYEPTVEEDDLFSEDELEMLQNGETPDEPPDERD